jgi:hypothetical protein
MLLEDAIQVLVRYRMSVGGDAKGLEMGFRRHSSSNAQVPCRSIC